MKDADEAGLAYQETHRPLLGWSLGVLVSGGVLAMDIALPLGVAGGVPYVALVLISIWSNKQRNTLIAASVGTILTLVGYFLSESVGVELWMVVLNRAFAVCAIWSVALLLLARRQADARSRVALLEKEGRFRILIDRAPYGIWLHDLDSNIVEVNHSSREKLGYTRAELLSMKMGDIESGLEGQRSPRAVVSNPEEALTYEASHKRKNGEIFPVEVRRTKICLEGRDLFLSCAVDITERKRTDAALRASEEKFRSVIQSIDGGILTLDSDGRVVIFSKGAEQIFGYTVDEMMGEQLACLIPLEFRDLHQKAVERAGQTGKFWIPSDTFALTGLRKDGTEFPLELTLGTWRTAGAVFITGFVRDITEMKRTEDENKRLEEQYRQVQNEESIGRLAGGVAHDLNNLLSPILGYGELLMEEVASNPAHRESLEQILQAGMQARDLVRQLLAFSRKQTLEYLPVDVAKLVLRVEKLLKRTIPEDIEIEIKQTSYLPSVMAGVGQIERVLMNLAVNAADAMPDGGRLTIETMAAELDETATAAHQGVQPGAYVLLVFSDNGSGMDEETREHLFEPFYSTKGERGTGLGLATVYGIVKQHGGMALVHSELGQGTTIKIYLPVSEETCVEEEVGSQSEAASGGTETIVLVEDNKRVRNLAHAILERQGYTVFSAEDGASALRMLEEHVGPVHLMLTDIIMPEMNGRELYTKAHLERPSLKVLYMSGYTDSVIANRGVLEDGLSFLQKPFTVQTLAANVREVLEQE